MRNFRAIILLILLVASCSRIPVPITPSPVVLTGTLQPTGSPQPTDVYLDIAPNNLWGMYYDTSQLILVKTMDHSEIAHIPRYASWGRLLSFRSWSPDSLKFALGGYDHYAEKATVDRVIVFRYAPVSGELTATVIRGPNNEKNRNELSSFVAWSPDSKKVAVSIDWVEFVILNENGQEIERIHPDKPAAEWAADIGWIYK